VEDWLDEETMCLLPGRIQGESEERTEDVRAQQRQQDELAAPVSAISTPNLSNEESAALLDCINAVRSGEKVFLVRLTNQKVTKSRKRQPGVDYRPDPALRPHAHEGLLVKAPTNGQGEVYLHILDQARRPGDEEHGHTRITMRGILSFRVLAEYTGPNGRAAPEPVAVAPQDMLAQSLLMQAQAMMSMAMALQQQAVNMQQRRR
jgi:hypothetical protein